jgi:FkbM family methyltransferase
MKDSSMASIREQLDGLLTAPCNDPEPLPAGRYVIYGAGARGRETLSILRARGCDVAAFIDRSATGQIDGVPVVSVVDPALAALAQDGCPAIVAVFNPGADPLPIHDQLENAGFRTVIGVVEARQRLAADDAYWLASTAAMTPSAADAAWLFEKLADDLSRATFLEAIALRRTRRPEFLRSVTPGDQYFPSGVPIPRTGVRFVDGGAFDGDTIANLIEAGFVFDGIAAFEPDPASYAALSSYLTKQSPCGEISVWPCGLDERTRQLEFAATGLVTSKASAVGSIMIQAVRFDTALPNFCPTYVKLDTEGAEAAALRGMKCSIQTSRPAIATSLYHRPADLWELPLLIQEILPEAHFYLRAHAFNGFELVLYVIFSEYSK